MGAILNLGAGWRTYALGGLQAAATIAYTLGYLTPEQYALAAQLFGWPMLGTVLHKVAREAQP